MAESNCREISTTSREANISMLDSSPRTIPQKSVRARDSPMEAKSLIDPILPKMKYNQHK